MMPIISDHGELSWSDGHSSSPEENHPGLLPPSPMWANAATTTTTMTRLETGQLSPISTELEVPATTASIPQMIHSATSSSHGSWTSYSEGDDAEHDMQWDHCADDMLVPKIEPSEEDDFDMDDVKEAPRTTPKPTPSSSGPGGKAKRPRGRPRKHPLIPQVAANKVAKGRSKTGCITCRKRKKKCDEAKPRCKPIYACWPRGQLLTIALGMNCEKNAVVCEGYNEKTIWKSGKERADEGRSTTRTDRMLPLLTGRPQHDAQAKVFHTLLFSQYFMVLRRRKTWCS